MVIKEEIIDKYIDNSLEFDLPVLVLKNKEYKITGSGTVKLSHNGELVLKMYSKKKDSIPFDYFINQYNKSFSDAGKIIQKEDYFILTGKKGIHCNFSCRQLSIGNCDENIIEGQLLNSFVISCPDNRQRKYRNAEIIISSNLKIPVNDRQNTEIVYPDGRKFSSYSRNTFLIRNSNDLILIFNKKNYLIINISSDIPKIDNLYIDNIIYSLSFLLGRKVKWNIVKLLNGDNEYRFLYNSNNSINNGPMLSKPPFDFVCYFEKPEHSERLFNNYFNFISSDQKRNLYKIVNRNILASYSYLHVFGLTLSASIEELLKIYFSNYNEKITIKLEEIADVENVLSKLNISEHLKTRLKGFLKSINNNTQIKDIFRTLQERKLLNQGQIRDWNKLRNSSAHGDITNNFDTQSHLDLVYKNLVLYYKIIFLIIGYKGLYSNYGVYGHPCDSFDFEI